MSIVGRIDRYVGRTVLEAYLGALVFMMFLSILIDMLMNMSRYLQIGEEYEIYCRHVRRWMHRLKGWDGMKEE